MRPSSYPLQRSRHQRAARKLLMAFLLLLAGLSIGLIRERIQRHRKARKEGTLA